MDKPIPEYFKNDNLQDLVSPIKADVLVKLLKQANYKKEEIDFLHKGFTQGFTQGFSIEYHGPESR